MMTMTTCDYCGAENDATRLACCTCSRPVHKPAPAPLTIGDGEVGRDFFALDLDEPVPPQRGCLKAAHRFAQKSGGQAQSSAPSSWWQRLVQSTDQFLREPNGPMPVAEAMTQP